MPKPLTFQFNLEPGLSDSEIAALWDRTVDAQNALDDFLAGRISEYDMTDLLSWNGVDLLETERTLESNLTVLGVL